MKKMTSLAGVHYEGQVPLDLRVRRDQPENDLFPSNGSSVRSYPSGGAVVEETDELLSMHDSILKIVKQEKETHFDCNGETIQFSYTAKEELFLPPERLAQETNETFFKFIKQENGRFDYKGKAVHLPYPAEREFYPNKAGPLHNVTVKQEPGELEEPETDNTYFKPNKETFSFADDFLSKADNSSDEDNLIIDLNFEETTSGKKRLDRSNSNCSTNSNSSWTSESGDDIKAFLRNYSSPFKEHKCSKCKVRFGELYSLFVHLDEHVSQNPGERFMKCPVCMRKFQRIFGIAAHIRKMHLGPMEHICRFCQTAFKFNLHLQKHETNCKKRKKKDSTDGNECG